MAVVVGFHIDVISCKLARRGVRRGAAKASGSDEVQCTWAWQRGQCDIDLQPMALFLNCESKKQDIKLLPITSPINRFSNIFSLADSVVNLQQIHHALNMSLRYLVKYVHCMSEKWRQSENCIVIHKYCDYS